MSSPVSRRFVFNCTPSARHFLLQEGTDSTFGARHLKRSIERHLVFPLANLLATGQIELGDLVTIDHKAGTSKLTFVREVGGALVGDLATHGLLAHWVPPTRQQSPIASQVQSEFVV